MKFQDLIVIGAGGHGRVVAEAAAASGRYRLAAFADDRYADEGIELGIVRVPVESLYTLLGKLDDPAIVVAIGDNAARKRLVERLALPDKLYATVIHPSAVLSPTSFIGNGSVVMAGAVLNADAVVGRHAIVNTNAVVEHDCRAGDFAHISPAAAMAGASVLEDGAHAGVGSCLLPGITVGAWSTLGAGAVAIRNVPANCTAVGVPALSIRSNRLVTADGHGTERTLAGGARR